MAINKISRNSVEIFKRLNKYTDERGENSLDAYQEIAGGSAIYPGQGTPLGLAYVALKLNGEAGEFAEHVGKAMRDDQLLGPLLPKLYPEEAKFNSYVVRTSGPLDVHVFASYDLTPERREALKKELGDQLWYIAAGARELGFTLSDIALGNLEKLLDRQERGKLQGSGDER